jgi:hypothetical protein
MFLYVSLYVFICFICFSLLILDMTAIIKIRWTLQVEFVVVGRTIIPGYLHVSHTSNPTRHTGTVVKPILTQEFKDKCFEMCAKYFA